MGKLRQSAVKWFFPHCIEDLEQGQAEPPELLLLALTQFHHLGNLLFSLRIYKLGGGVIKQKVE